MNGIVISQQSSVLLALVQQQNEVYLDQFVGEEEGLRECIALLYGAEVELNIGNIGIVLKFSVLYEIREMFELVIGWVDNNVCEENLGELINHVLKIEKVMCSQLDDLLDSLYAKLRQFIDNDLKCDLVKLAKDWKIADKKGFINFLIDKDSLHFTVLTSLVEGDSDIKLVIDRLEAKAILLSMDNHGDEALDLLDKMGDKVESLETSKRVMKFQKAYYRCEKNVPQQHDGISDEPQLTEIVGTLSLNADKAVPEEPSSSSLGREGPDGSQHDDKGDWEEVDAAVEYFYPARGGLRPKGGGLGGYAKRGFNRKEAGSGRADREDFQEGDRPPRRRRFHNRDRRSTATESKIKRVLRLD